MKKIKLLLLLTITTVSLTACGKKKTVDTTAVSNDEIEESDVEVEVAEDEEDSYEEEEFEGEYGAYSDGAEWGNNYEGSAVYLDGKTAVVTIEVSPEDDEFTEEELNAEKKKLETALDFITEQAKKYKAKTEFVFNEEDLNVSYSYDGEDIASFEGEDYDGIISELKSEGLNTKKIRENYKADGIAYVFILKGTGDSFAAPHWKEDEIYYQSEAAFIYTNGYDARYEETENGPSVYAYQLLRLFGAVELAEPDPTYGYTTALCNSVRDHYSNDIMFHVYDKDGKIDANNISQEITDITAYSLGLVDSFSELKENPSFVKEDKACFVDHYSDNTDENEESSDYDWDDSWDEDIYGYEEELEDSLDDGEDYGIDELEDDFDSYSEDTDDTDDSEDSAVFDAVN